MNYPFKYRHLKVVLGTYHGGGGGGRKSTQGFICLTSSPGQLLAPLLAQSAKNLPPMQETWVRSLDWEDPLGKATHCSILA